MRRVLLAAPPALVVVLSDLLDHGPGLMAVAAPTSRPDRTPPSCPSAAGLLAAFNRAGVLSAADVHVARRLAQLAGEDDERVALAAALAVRGAPFGHVYVDLGAVRGRAADEDDELDWRPALAGADEWLVGWPRARGLGR